jgi:hypothetical protein
VIFRVIINTGFHGSISSICFDTGIAGWYIHEAPDVGTALPGILPLRKLQPDIFYAHEKGEQKLPEKTCGWPTV